MQGRDIHTYSRAFPFTPGVNSSMDEVSGH